MRWNRLSVLLVVLAGLPAISMADEPPCPLPNDPDLLLGAIWPLADANSDGGLSESEIDAISPGSGSLLIQYGDLNHDGKVSLPEALNLFNLLPVDLLGLVDGSGDGVLEYEEVSEYATEEQFATLDKNNNGVIDCGDLADVPPVEGELEPPCPLRGDFTSLAPLLWPIADTDGNGGISTEEVAALYPDYPQDLFGVYDVNDDDEVTLEEISQIAFFVAPPDLIPFMEILDANDDGLLDGNEIGDAKVGRLDTNNNGVVDCADTPGGNPEGEAWPEGELPPNACPLPPDFDSLAQLLWPVLDVDKSGGLSLEEILRVYPDFPTETFPYIDADEDGEITLEEINQIVYILETEPGINIVPPPMFIDLLALLDKNGDSLLSWAELSEYVDEDTFDELDANDNGVLDCEDFPAVEPEEGEIEPPLPCALVGFFVTTFDGMDVDNDEAVTEAEFIGVIALLLSPVDYTPVFPAADANDDHFVTRAELDSLAAECGYEGETEPANPCLLFVYYGNDLLGYDADNNGKIAFAELPPIYFIAGDNNSPNVAPLIYPGPDDPHAVFMAADANNDAHLDANEIAGLRAQCQVEGEPEGDPNVEGEPVEEGEEEKEGEVVSEGDPAVEGEGEVVVTPDLCPYAPLLHSLFPMLDANKDGAITPDELGSIAFQLGFVMPDLAVLFEAADLDDDGGVTLAEIQALVERCEGNADPGDEGEAGSNEGETNPVEGESDPDPNQRGTVILERRVDGNGTYVPGQEVVIVTELKALPRELPLTALGLVETLPQGWSITRVIEGGEALSVPTSGDSGEVEFAWGDIPRLPVRVAYGVTLDDADGPQVILGHAVFRVGPGGEQHGPVLATPIGRGLDDSFCHSGDFDHDWQFSLTELLRIVQMFNLGGFDCADATEDGYRPGGLINRLCQLHSGDIDGDWSFSLGELLRIIQFYNSDDSAYQRDDEAATEDGFVPGRFTL